MNQETTIQQMENKLTEIGFFVGGLNDQQIEYYYMILIVNGGYSTNY